jgi:hypothetical protein
MITTHHFNFTDWKGDAHTGEVLKSQVSGEYVPDSILGMGKNYSDAERGVADYLRRMGATLIGSLIETTAHKKDAVQSQAIAECHVPRGVSLADFEGLDLTGSDVPDWMKHSKAMQFSGALRELSDDLYDPESGANRTLCLYVDQAAERLDQAHVEYLKAKAAPLARESIVEQSLRWAHQNGYCFSAAALDEYCDPRGLEWLDDARYCFVTITEKGA